MAHHYDVVIVGGGVVGLVTAWRTAQRGLTVAVVDPTPARGAAHVAAGMLTPVTEVTYGEEPLLRLGLESHHRYPEFVAELEEETGQVTGYRAEGVLQVAFDADDLAVLDDLRSFRESLGLRVERLTSRDMRRLEPMLAPSVRGGLFAPQDGAIDPRRLTAALLEAARRRGTAILPERAVEVVADDDGAQGVRLADGSDVAAAKVVLAAGCWSGEIAGVPPAARPPVRPVKGQVIRVHATPQILSRATRGLVRGSSIYLVPRADGDIVIGATQEEMGYDTRVTAGGVWELLRDAHELLPGVTELELTETLAGLRPGSPDNAPLLGETALPGLYAATGHFRNGILLTAITGDVMAEILATGRTPKVAAPFAPARFASLSEGVGT